MTLREFKKKFKVGDVVSNQYNQGGTITAIGEETFLTITDISQEKWFGIIGNDWVKVEPEKKPSEEIAEKENVAEFDKRKNAEYANKMIDVIQQWLDFVKVEPKNKPSEEINELIKLHRNSNPQFNMMAPITPSDRIDAIIEWLDENWPKVVKK